MSFSNIRISSDGHPMGLTVSTKGGEAIPVKSVHFTQNAGEAPVVTLVLEGVQVDLASGPGCLEQARAEASDEADDVI